MAESEMYNALIKKDSREGSFLMSIRSALEKRDVPAMDKNIIYSIFRQAVVDGTEIDKLLFLKDVSDAEALREYIIFIRDGCDAETMKLLLKEKSSADDIRQKRYDYIMEMFSVVSEEELRGGADAVVPLPGAFVPDPRDAIEELQKISKKLLSYLSGEKTKMDEEILGLQKEKAQLEAELQRTKRIVYETRISGMKKRTEPLNMEKSGTKEEDGSRAKGRRWPWQKSGKESQRDDISQGDRKEQLLLLLQKDITAGQMRFLSETFRENPEIPFDLLNAIARKDLSVTEMKAMIETYKVIEQEKEEKDEKRKKQE